VTCLQMRWLNTFSRRPPSPTRLGPRVNPACLARTAMRSYAASWWVSPRPKAIPQASFANTGPSDSWVAF
jgi:hypothetical protein